MSENELPDWQPGLLESIGQAGLQLSSAPPGALAPGVSARVGHSTAKTIEFERPIPGAQCHCMCACVPHAWQPSATG